jgi:hypothetical protein
LSSSIQQMYQCERKKEFEVEGDRQVMQSLFIQCLTDKVFAHFTILKAQQLYGLKLRLAVGYVPSVLRTVYACILLFPTRVIGFILVYLRG